MKLLHCIMARISACLRPNRIRPGREGTASTDNFASPPLLLEEESSQELLETRERILSRLLRWRVQECRRELLQPHTSHAEILPFPLTAAGQSSARRHHNA